MEGQSQQPNPNCTAAICQPLWKQQHREEKLLPYPVHLFGPDWFCSIFGAFQSPADGEIPLSLLPITALQKKGTFASEAWYLSFVGFSDVAAERRGETETCKRNVADNL